MRGRWLGLIVSLGLVGCDEAGESPSRDAGVVDAGLGGPHPGFGDDPGPPRGTPWTPPNGIAISGPVVGADDLTSDCGDGSPGYGSGVYVQVCVRLRNTTGGPVEVVFPPGLVVVSTSEGFQNGLLVERIVIRVPPTPPPPGGFPDGGVDDGAYVVPLFAYCLNESRNPNETGTPYAIGPVTDDAAMRDLLTLVGDARIDTEDEVDVVQSAIYSITEEHGLTSEDRDALRGLD